MYLTGQAIVFFLCLVIERIFTFRFDHLEMRTRTAQRKWRRRFAVNGFFLISPGDVLDLCFTADTQFQIMKYLRDMKRPLHKHHHLKFNRFSSRTYWTIHDGPWIRTLFDCLRKEAYSEGKNKHLVSEAQGKKCGVSRGERPCRWNSMWGTLKCSRIQLNETERKSLPRSLDHWCRFVGAGLKCSFCAVARINITNISSEKSLFKILIGYLFLQTHSRKSFSRVKCA